MQEQLDVKKEGQYLRTLIPARLCCNVCKNGQMQTTTDPLQIRFYCTKVMDISWASGGEYPIMTRCAMAETK